MQSKAFSHNRFHSYSTVSSRAPATPPTDVHYEVFENGAKNVSERERIQDSTGEQTEGNHGALSGVQDIMPIPNGHSSASQSHYDEAQHTNMLRQQRSFKKPLPWKSRGSQAPRIESMIIKSALSNGSLDESSRLSSENGDDIAEGSKTPLAEGRDSLLQESSSGHTMRLEGVPSQGSKEALNGHDARMNASEEESEDAGDVASTDRERKGKARAVDQDADTFANGTDPEDTSTRGLSPQAMQPQPSAANSPAGGEDRLPNPTMPTSSSGRKISDLLREQYETRQRSGASAVPMLPRQQPSPVVRPPPSTVPSTSDAASTQTLSPRGRGPTSLPSQDSFECHRATDAQAERAQLLHTIIRQDFSGSPPVTGGFISPPTKELPWHPTEYVGPPRRRSMSGTSILGFGRKGQTTTRMPHQRQKSADVLTIRAKVEDTNDADQFGRRKAFAASADDLLTRKASIQKRSEASLPAQNGFNSTKGRLFSIKRKTPPVASAQSIPTPNKVPQSDAPFRSMIDTSHLPPQPRANPSSLGHKRSLSGSITSMLSSFGSSSHLRRKRNISTPDHPEMHSQPTFPASSTSGSGTHTETLSEFGNYTQQEQAPDSGSRISNGRQSPFKMWRYPPGKDGFAHERQASSPNVAVSSVYVTQTQVAAVSSPTPSEDSGRRPQSPFFKGPSRFHESSKALSSADTIAEDDGEDEEMHMADDSGDEEEDEESKRLKSLASHQVSVLED